MAELTAPITAKRTHSAPVSCVRARHRNGARISAPRASRTSTSATGPKRGLATRMKRNEEPQIAPSISSSTGVNHHEVVLLSGVAATEDIYMCASKLLGAHHNERLRGVARLSQSV